MIEMKYIMTFDEFTASSYTADKFLKGWAKMIAKQMYANEIPISIKPLGFPVGKLFYFEHKHKKDETP